MPFITRSSITTSGFSVKYFSSATMPSSASMTSKPFGFEHGAHAAAGQARVVDQQYFLFHACSRIAFAISSRRTT